MKPEIGDLVKLPTAPDKSPVSVLFPKKMSDFGLVVEISNSNIHTKDGKTKSGCVCSVISDGKIFQHWFEDLKIISKMEID